MRTHWSAKAQPFNGHKHWIMKSTGNGFSLGLRMRMEGESSLSISRKLELISLPDLQQSHTIHKSKTQTAAENFVKSKNVAARLSGTLSYTAGSTADRTQTIRPSACCVRCSVHASICMDCCDLQTQKAVAFYRRTLGNGASAILSKAIMEAGHTNLSKFVIFTLWKNGIWNRVHLREKQMRVTKYQYELKMMKKPLLAWKKFTKDELMERKASRIRELEEKLKLLENEIAKFSIETTSAEDEVHKFCLLLHILS